MEETGDASHLGLASEFDSELDPPVLSIPLERKIWSLLNDDILPTPSPMGAEGPRTTVPCLRRCASGWPGHGALQQPPGDPSPGR